MSLTKDISLSAVSKLSRSLNQANKKRNGILIGAFALALFVVFSSFSIAGGKIKADTLRNIRRAGTVANACLKNADLKQAEDIKELDYVEKAGKEKVFAHCFEGDSVQSVCAVLDETEWNDIRRPAYGEIAGTYPRESNQVMLSRRLLKKLSIDEPAIGMDIPLAMVYDDWSICSGEEQKQTFKLSGYYTEYLDETEGESSMYFSEKLMLERGIGWDKSNVYLKLTDSIFSGAILESRLYEDIEIESDQQMVVSDSAVYAAVEALAGGYAAAFLCAVIILLSAYMVIHNVLCISMNKEIRQYGLLAAIGTTSKQIKAVIRYQLWSIWVKGSLLGIFLCTLMGCSVLPALLRKLYMQGSGMIGVRQVFSVKIMFASLLFVSIMLITANGKSQKLLKKMTPVEAYRYTDTSSVSKVKAPKGGKYQEKGVSLLQIAKRNVFGSSKKYWMTILSLFLGCEAAVIAVFIGTGADITNQLKRNQDFVIGTNQKAVENYLFDGTEEDLSKELFAPDFLSKIQRLPDVNPESVSITYGGYCSIDLDEPALTPRKDAVADVNHLNTAAAIQVIDSADIESLEQYAEKNGLYMNLDAVREGNGTLILHRHELSRSQEELAGMLIGQPVHFYNNEESQAAEFENSGYLDITLKGFPELDMVPVSEGTNYFLVNEKGFSRLDTLEQAFRIGLNAREGREPELKKALSMLVHDENQNSQKEPVYYLKANSDTIKKLSTYITAAKTMMLALGVILLFMGFLNYANTIVTDYLSRKREYVIMHSIGMTGKQLRTILLNEGRIYAVSIWIGLLTVGNIFLFLLYLVIKRRLTYFTFIYPWKMSVFVILGIYMICTIVPEILYRQDAGKSVIEKMSQNDGM